MLKRPSRLAVPVVLMAVVLLATQIGAILHAIEHPPNERHASCHICIAAQHSGDCLTTSIPFLVTALSCGAFVSPLQSVFLESSRPDIPVRGPPVAPPLA
ncbi:MAG: hypothetical protein AMJ46_02565 [Latescibacteria bacterium DG_63]|nr:MAG: hypothetical protein AMJ46_02565 [Latescibacteria bacterium DG_63]